MKSLSVCYILVSLFFVGFSYLFIDPNLHILPYQSNVPMGGTTTLVVGVLIVFLFILFCRVLTGKFRNPIPLIGIVASILLFSYPLFSYDIFNYILTAKVTYVWRENPYLVMPIEIPNDPNLLFTRAANKLALYGPTWIGATFFPSLVGFGNVWVSIIAFKVLVGAWYGFFLWMIYRVTRSKWNVIFFALNPLVLSEVLINGHNDITMMVLAIGSLLLWRNDQVKSRILGVLCFVASIFVKGATLVLVPLFFVRWPMEKMWRIGFLLMFGVFLLTPIREELYPWYAIWFLSFAALLPPQKAIFIHGFSIALSLGLLLRHLPYIATREYGGTGPLWRTILTVVPVTMYFAWKGIKKYV